MVSATETVEEILRPLVGPDQAAVTAVTIVAALRQARLLHEWRTPSDDPDEEIGSPS